MPLSELKMEWPDADGRVCDARDLSLEIELLERRIRRVHRELAAGHFAAARGALAAARNSSAPAREVAAAADALRGAYNACKQESVATQTVGFLIPRRAPVVENPIALHKELACIASMAAVLYRYLGLVKEEREWRVAATLDFDEAVEKFAERIGRLHRPALVPSPVQGRFFKDVEALDPDFVLERADGGTIPRLSRRGKRYFETACQEARERFKTAVGSVQFTL
ncbi:MAG: hypothetical protein ACLPX9_06415 [Rhodomicrobium sp.]